MSVVPKNRGAMLGIPEGQTVLGTMALQTLFRTGDVVVLLDGKGCVSGVMM